VAHNRGPGCVFLYISISTFGSITFHRWPLPHEKTAIIPTLDSQKVKVVSPFGGSDPRVVSPCPTYLQPGYEVGAGGALAPARGQRVHLVAEEVVFRGGVAAVLLEARREQHRDPIQVLLQERRAGAFYSHCA
jgi:hypothetical protein